MFLRRKYTGLPVGCSIVLNKYMQRHINPPIQAAACREGLLLAEAEIYLRGWSYNYRMVILNYEMFLREKIQEEVEQCHDTQARGALLSK